MAKYGYISNLAIPEIGDEHQIYVKKVANSLMEIASLIEKKNANKSQSKTVKDALEIIRTDPAEWKEYEKEILDNIDNYIKNGYKGKYCFEDNDVCVGTLNLLDFIYKQAVNNGANYLQYDRVKKMMKSMKKINEKTIEEAEIDMN